MNYKRILGPHHFAIAACMVSRSSGLCSSSRLQLGHRRKVTHLLYFSHRTESLRPSRKWRWKRHCSHMEDDRVGQADEHTVMMEPEAPREGWSFLRWTQGRFSSLRLRGDYVEFVSKQTQLEKAGSKQSMRLRNVTFKILLWAKGNTPDIWS